MLSIKEIVANNYAHDEESGRHEVLTLKVSNWLSKMRAKSEVPKGAWREFHELTGLSVN